MASKSAPTSGAKADRPAALKRAPQPAADEGRDPVDTTPVTSAPAKKPSASKGKPRGPYNVVRVDKKPVSYRLPADVIALIEQARVDAAKNGERLTNDDVVAQAIRAHWGKRRRR